MTYLSFKIGLHGTSALELKIRFPGILRPHLTWENIQKSSTGFTPVIPPFSAWCYHLQHFDLTSKFHQNRIIHLVPDSFLNGGLELRDARDRLLLVELLEHLVGVVAAAAVGSTAFFQVGK